MRHFSSKSVLATSLILSLLITVAPAPVLATVYDVSGIPSKNTGDAITASEVNLIVDMLRNVKKDDRGDVDVTNDRIGIGVAGTPAYMLDVNGTVNASAFIGDGSQLTNLPNPSPWGSTASDIYFNTGKVAIGINTSPTYELEVHNTASSANLSVVAGGTDNNAIVRLINDSQEWVLRNRGASGDTFQIRNMTGAVDVLTIDATTNNITTSNDITATGDITGDTITATNFIDAGTGSTIGGLWVEGAENDEIYFDADNVGIGIANPAYPLHVTGDTKLDNHLAVGTTATPLATSVVKIDENSATDSDNILLNVQGTASGAITASRTFRGGYIDAETTQTETAGHAVTEGLYSRARSSGSATFNQLRGMHGVAYNDSAAGAGLGSLIGVRGEAYNNDTVATLPTAYGGFFVGRGRSTLPAGPITTLYGVRSEASAYEANIGTAYGAYNYARTINGDTGDIANAYGSYNRVRVDSTSGGDITTGYGVYSLLDGAVGSTEFTTGTGVYSDVNNAVTAYGGRFYADDPAATTNYGIVSSASGGINNYALFSSDGDWILDADGDGGAGGVGSDLIIGESADLRIYHNGNDSVIQNQTGDLVLQNNGSGNIGIGTASPQKPLHIVGPDGAVPSFPTAGATNDVLIIENNDNSNLGIIAGAASTSSIKFYDSAASIWQGIVLYNHVNDALFLGASGSERLIVNSTGDVGIGDLTPDLTLKLDVEGQIGATEYCDANGANCTLAADLGGAKWLDGVGVNEIHYSAGNVGIGTTDPRSALDVGGAGEYISVGLDGGAPGMKIGEFTNVALGPDIAINAAGSIAAESSLHIIIDSDNDETDSSFFVKNNSSTSGGSTKLFQIEESGQVGVGSTAPTEELHVRKDQAAPTTIAVQNASTSTNTNTRAGFTAVANGGQLDIYHAGAAATGSTGGQTKADAAVIRTTSGAPSSKMIIGNGGNVPLHLITNDATRMTVLGNGNVGIGETSPSAKLDVNGSLRVTTPGSSWITGKTGTGGINASTAQTVGAYHPFLRQTTSSGHVVNLGGLGDDFGFFGYDSARVINGYDYTLIMDLLNGNIGIGTTSPSEELYVTKTQTEPTTIIAQNSSTSAGANVRSGFAASANGGQLDIMHYGTAATGTLGGQTKADAAYIRTNSGIPSSKMIIGNGGNVPLHLITNDTTRMTILGNGRVGLKDSAPASLFQVGDDSVVDADAYITFGDRVVTSETNLPFIGQDSRNAASNDLGIGARGGTGGINFYTGNVSAFQASNRRMRLDSTGDLGIGDDTPDGTLKLDVEGRIGATQYCDENGANCTLAAALGSGYWSKTGDDVWYSPGATGEVGIGLSNPSEELVVSRSQAAPTTVAALNSSASSNTNTRAGFTAQSNAGAIDMMVYSSAATGNLADQAKADTAYVRTSSSAPVSKMVIGNGGNVPLHLITNDDTRVTVEANGDVSHSGSLYSDGATYRSRWMRYQEILNGNSVGIGSGGHTVVGSGESVDQIMNNVAANTEQMSVASDGGIRMYTGVQSGWGTRVEAMEIEADGRVGIGTIGPSEELHVFKSQANPTTIVSGNTSTSTNTNTRAGFTAAANGGQLDVMQYGSAATGSLAGQTKADAAYIRTSSGSPSSKMVIGNGGNVPLHLITNDLTRMTVLGNGNVGIGTTNPSTKLQVYQSTAGTPAVFETGGGYSAIQIKDTTGSVNLLSTGGNYAVQAGGGERFRVESTGDVGIGITNPITSLHIRRPSPHVYQADSDNTSATADALIRAYDSAGTQMSYMGRSNGVLYMINVDGDDLRLGTSGGTDLTIEPSGEVGIGTTAPAAKLHVSASAANLRLTDTDTGADGFVLTNSSVGGMILSADHNDEVASSYLGFNVDGTERGRFDSAGAFRFSGNIRRSSGTLKCPTGEVMVGFDTSGIMCEEPTLIYN